MITAKRIFYSATLLLAGVMLAATIAYLLVDDETLVAWIAESTEKAAGINIYYQAPVKLTRTLSPTLTVSELSVGDPATGYLVQTSSLEVQISLLPLILGRLDIPRLWLGDTRIELSAAAASGKKAIAPSADEQHSMPPMPKLRDLQIPSLQVVSGQGEMRLPTLDVEQLTISLEGDTDRLQLAAQIDMADEPVTIEANVPQFHDGLNARSLSFSASARSAVASLVAKGQLNFAKPQFILDGNLSVQASDLKRLPTVIQNLQAPGTVTAQAQLAGTIDQLALSNLRVQWQGPAQSSLEIRGRIDDVDDFTGVALEVSGQLGESPWLAALLPDSVGTIKYAELSGQISGAGRQLQIRDFSLTARDANELDVALSGRLDLAVTQDKAKPKNLDLKLAFSAPTTRAARVLLFDDIAELGAIEGKADIVSENGHPAFENIVLSAHDAEGIDVDLKGRIAEFPLDPAPNRGYDLDVSMQATQASLMADRLGLELPLAGPADVRYRIEGDTQALRLEQVKLTVGKKNVLQLSAEGQVHFRNWDAPDPLRMINLGLQMHSRDTRQLAKLLGTELPELGALTAEARLQTVSNRHRVTGFRLRTNKGAPLAVTLSGAAHQVVLLPKPAIKEIALRASASTTDVTRLNTLFGWQDAIPAIGAAKATARLSGNDQRLSVSHVSISAGTPDILLVETKGRLGTLAAKNNWRPQNADLSLRANADGSKALAELLGFDLPELGPLAASAKIRGKGKRLALESGQLVVGDVRRPAIEAGGFVADLFGAGKTRWDIFLDLNEHQFAAFADKHKLPGLGALRGTLQISNSDGNLGIDRLSLKSTGTELLTLDIAGQYGDFSKPDSLSLTGKLKARDMMTLGALFDQDWPAVGPVSVDTRVSKSGEQTAFYTRMAVDEFELDADMVADLRAEPARLSGNIKARNAFILQFAEPTAENVEQKRASKEPFFSREPITFDWLNKVDLDLSVDVESFDPELARGESAQARIKLQSGRLSVAPATIEYPKGRLELDLRVEAQDRPTISFKAFGESLDPWRSLYMEEAKKELDADLDIDIGLSLSGESAHELAASAQGNIFLELKNGKIRRELIDLVFVDIVGWIWGKTRHEKFYDIACGVADYRIDQGVVTTEAFLLDASHLTVSGNGTIDLGQEQVDYVFLPKKKSRIISRADPVRVTGALNDPSVKVIPWRSAASTYGTLWFAPYIFVGVAAVDFLAGAINKGSKVSPCQEYEKKLAARREVAAP